jgi:hypothetical protein
MLFWFIGTAWLAVWYVFRDPRFDYRMLAIGALLPDVLDLVLNAAGGWRPFHSVTMSIAALVAVMLATYGRRPIRRRLLALPIGMFMHLIFDAAFSSTKTFWWPFTGTGFVTAQIPSIERLPVGALLEVVGVALVWWCAKRAHLNDPDKLAAFRQHGTLDLS